MSGSEEITYEIGEIAMATFVLIIGFSFYTFYSNTDVLEIKRFSSDLSLSLSSISDEKTFSLEIELPKNLEEYTFEYDEENKEISFEKDNFFYSKKHFGNEIKNFERKENVLFFYS